MLVLYRCSLLIVIGSFSIVLLAVTSSVYHQDSFQDCSMCYVFPDLPLQYSPQIHKHYCCRLTFYSFILSLFHFIHFNLSLIGTFSSDDKLNKLYLK